MTRIHRKMEAAVAMIRASIQAARFTGPAAAPARVTTPMTRRA